eukprot:jgi/Chlat1/6237/Chrsp44S09044
MPSTTMATRELGRGSGVRVSALGLGCMGMSFAYGAADEGESLATLNAALDAGCTFWDTAELYGMGKNEELLAKARTRSEVFLCTKFGATVVDGQFHCNGSPAYVKEACAKSLKRLGVDQIDLYYQHRVDQETPIEETVKAMAELVKEGKVRFLGLSECTADQLRRAHAVHPISAVQMEYSPWTLDIETNGVLDTCRELGVSVVAYSPLGRGFLTGRFKSPEDFDADDGRRGHPRFTGENFTKNLEIVKKIEEIASKKGCTAGQLALAWVLAQGEDIIPIPGTKRVKYLKENLGALDVKLDKGEVDAVRSIINELPVAGERYPAQHMRHVVR